MFPTPAPAHTPPRRTALTIVPPLPRHRVTRSPLSAPTSFPPVPRSSQAMQQAMQAHHPPADYSRGHGGLLPPAQIVAPLHDVTAQFNALSLAGAPAGNAASSSTATPSLGSLFHLGHATTPLTYTCGFAVPFDIAAAGRCDARCPNIHALILHLMRDHGVHAMSQADAVSSGVPVEIYAMVRHWEPPRRGSVIYLVMVLFSLSALRLSASSPWFECSELGGNIRDAPWLLTLSMLHWRDRHSLQTVLHVVVQSVLERTSDDGVDDALDEIRQTVVDALESHALCRARDSDPTALDSERDLVSFAFQSSNDCPAPSALAFSASTTPLAPTFNPLDVDAAFPSATNGDVTVPVDAQLSAPNVSHPPTTISASTDTALNFVEASAYPSSAAASEAPLPGAPLLRAAERDRVSFASQNSDGCPAPTTSSLSAHLAPAFDRLETFATPHFTGASAEAPLAGAPPALSAERDKVSFAFQSPAPRASTAPALPAPAFNLLAHFAAGHSSSVPSLAIAPHRQSLRRATIYSLPHEVLRTVFFMLLSTQVRGRLKYLICASHVCRTWRKLINAHGPLWSVLCGLSACEYRHLVRLLPRSQKEPVHVELDFRPRPSCSVRAVALTLANHTSRVRRLDVYIGRDQVMEWNALEAALEMPAPTLEECTISFPSGRFALPTLLFGRRAPRLKTLTLHVDLLPDVCPALKDVTLLTALPGIRAPTQQELARVITLCPRLEALVLDLPPEEKTASQRSPADALPLLSYLQVKDSCERRGSSSVLALLQLLRHTRLKTLRVVSPSPATLETLRKDMPPAAELFLAHPSEASAHVAFRAADASLAFLSTPRAAVDAVLQDAALLAGLRALHLGIAQRAADWARLSAASLPQLRLLTLFVVEPVPHALLVDIFQAAAAAGQRRWALPALERLCIRATEALVDVEPAGWRPTVSAVRLRRLVDESLSVPALELALDGVAFEEQWAGPEVAEVRRVVASIVSLNYPV